jgi:hypothetical protein
MIGRDWPRHRRNHGTRSGQGSTDRRRRRARPPHASLTASTAVIILRTKRNSALLAPLFLSISAGITGRACDYSPAASATTTRCSGRSARQSITCNRRLGPRIPGWVNSPPGSIITTTRPRDAVTARSRSGGTARNCRRPHRAAERVIESSSRPSTRSRCQSPRGSTVWLYDKHGDTFLRRETFYRTQNA